MTLKERIDLLATLGDYLLSAPEAEIEPVLHKAWLENKWFTTDHTKQALQAIATQMLDKTKLTKWAAHYQVPKKGMPTQVVGVIMAGNIPLVGFSDWLAVFVSGQRASVKLSSKDSVLLPWLVRQMGEWAPQSRAYTHFLGEHEPLSDFDSVIATGSNNTSRYFEQYFGKYPHLIRHNRVSVAVLTGKETSDELRALSVDIHQYFGLGCRNVAKLYVPKNIDLEALTIGLDHYEHFQHHDKYRNNYDYNTTLYIMNKMPYYSNPSLILREDKALNSRISCVHYEYYTSLKELNTTLLAQREDIQCVATHAKLSSELPLVAFGQTQQPSLMDYPDGVDVMGFIL